MKPTFENSVDVLVKAYLNDTLVHGNCYACAVGNLVCSSMGLTMSKGHNESNREVHWVGRRYPGWPNGWGAVISSDFNEDEDGNETIVQECDPTNFKGEPRRQIESTGYTVEQLARIEYAFESARVGEASGRDVMYDGLLAVVNVLAEIHSVDLSTKEAAVGQFEEIHATK